MNNKEAIASLKTLCNTCTMFPKCVNNKPECFQAIEKAISALKKQEQGRWHSVAKEGNPKEEGLYIITKKLRNRNGMEMYKVAVDRWSQDGLGKEWSYNSNVFVSAWRPLPEPYTEEEDEEQKSGNRVVFDAQGKICKN